MIESSPKSVKTIGNEREKRFGIMMKIISLVMCMLAVTCVTKAQDTIAVNNTKLIRVGDSVQLAMRIDMKQSVIGKKEIVLIEPVIETKSSVAVLPSVGIYGRDPYYYYIRSGHNWLQEGETDMMLRAKAIERPIDYVATVPYEAWMDTARVNITISSNHYCEGSTELSGFTVYTAKPTIVEGHTYTTAKTYSAKGTAYIDYVVNITEINPTYHNNARELRKIKQCIDSIRTDTANTISGITIKGYASPEGPYDNNVRLAKGRSESLTRHIADTYNIPRELMHTDYQPEDWEGLYRSVKESNLPHKAEILAHIEDSTLNDDLDAKLQQVKVKYPKDYQYILQNIMPYLRHSDYTINYHKDEFDVVEEKGDTIWELPDEGGELLPPTQARLKPFRPIFALKTNMLFDALMTPNFEIEVPFGRKRNWSIMVEDWFPWWLFNKNKKGDSNPYKWLGVPYKRSGDKSYKSAYELWVVGVEVRRWFNRCAVQTPLMTGHFVGLYAASGKYDIERNSVGDQGEFQSYGITWGYSWLLGRRWNLEVSASAGVLWGPQRHYHGEFDDTHLIWKENRNFTYVGPTKLKLSIVWLWGNTLPKHRKEVRDE